MSVRPSPSRARHDQPTLLVIDDDARICEMLERFAPKHGYQVITAGSGEEGLALLESHAPDLALVDLRLPAIGGLDVLRVIRDVDPHCQVILMTGSSTIETAIEAIKLGALDYLAKPFDFDRLRQLLQMVADEVTQRRKLLETESVLAHDLEFCGMIGRSAAMQQLFALIRRLAPYAGTALISGETGTGKELVARALHRSGPRKNRKFVTVNCSAVVESLFESELFGHMRGSFTGAVDHKAGLFEAADGGTLFLDEVGELPLSVQAKLLRVLEVGEVQRVGSLEPRKVDVRIVAATNRDLPAEVGAGRFRRDLLYRLNVVELHLVPLRERREDIPYLTAAFVREFAARLERSIEGVEPAAEALLSGNRWEGNVRELRNAIERACILAEGRFITERDLARSVGPAASSTGQRALAAGDSRRLVDAEREHILEVLREVGGSKGRAAEALGLSRYALYRKLIRLGITQQA